MNSDSTTTTQEPIRRYTEMHQVIRGVYLVQVRENRATATEKHRLVAQEVAHGKRKAERTAKELWQRYSDPKIG